MSIQRPHSTAKRATSIRVRGDLLDAARSAKINLSATLEEALTGKLKETNARKWRSENRAALANYNDYVDEHGAFSDGSRNF